MNELYGSFNLNTGEWTDGLVAILVREKHSTTGAPPRTPIAIPAIGALASIVFLAIELSTMIEAAL